MKARQGLLVVLALAAVGCGTFKTGREPVVLKEARIIKAVRVAKPPAIDGKLDDAVWKEAQEITGFTRHKSDERAAYQSFGYVLYDDAHLYVGMKCLLPKGVKPRGEARPHDGNIWRDDVVEVMLDPDRTRSGYYQLVVNAYGATFDAFRRGDDYEDDAWNGEWAGKSHIGDGFFSVEMAIPFHNLGITPRVGPTWGINLCRDTQNPEELSAIAVDGAFNEPDKFPLLKALTADLRKYAFEIGACRTVLEPSRGKLVAQISVPVTNLSGRKRKVRIDIHRTGPGGKEGIEKRQVEMANGASITLPLGKLPVKPVIQGKLAARKIVIRDAGTGIVLSTTLIRQPLLPEAMRVEVDDPRRGDTPSRRTGVVSLKVDLALPKAYLKNGALAVTLTSRKSGKEVAHKVVKALSPVTRVGLDTRSLPWGAYDARVAFKNAAREVLATTKRVSVLPGRPHQIRVLNNLVSELMDAGARGLIWEKKTEFMNPRDGWCFFSLSGAATLRLDSDDKPFMTGRQGEKAAEAMRRLPAGRHVLRVEGQPEELVVRAIPEIVHTGILYTPSPFLAGYPTYTWEFLEESGILDNANVFLERTRPPEKTPPDHTIHCRDWKRQGKKIMTRGGLSYLRNAANPFTAENVCDYLLDSPGFTLPDHDGMIMSEFSSGGGRWPAEYPVLTEAIRRLSESPKFQGKAFYPYCWNLYQSEPSRAFVRAVIDAGGKLAEERYLAEQPTEAEAWKHLDSRLRQSMLRYQEAFPHCQEHMIMTLGYLSAPPETLNMNPGVNYKVYLDMQFNHLANEQAFRGLYGVICYHSAYADEEVLRWSARLFRHYCIEGKSEMLSTDPYLLPHIRNGDFADGTAGWTMSPAEEGSMGVKSVPGYSWLQCRYPKTEQGNTFLWAKRSPRKPNRFSQQIKELKPGRLYSLKMFTADYQHLVRQKGVKEQYEVAIDVDNVDMIADKSFREIYGSGRAGHSFGKFDRKNNLWITFYRLVFRAKALTATLTVSDWQSDPSTSSPRGRSGQAGQEEPGGPVGQELMFNFIEIQPYMGD